jgi:Fur family transcriptional regulator, ferric uptake regulator
MEESIDRSLESKNVKPTAMRQLVLDILSKQESAIDLPELELQFAKADRTTLYRTLKTFVQNKLVHSIDDGTGTLKYAICNDSCRCNPNDLHVHFFCMKCGKTTCLTDIPIPEVNLPEKYSVVGINMVVKGLCDKCNS